MHLPRLSMAIRALRLPLMLSILLAAAPGSGNMDLMRMERLALSRYGADTADLVGRWRDMLDEIAQLPVENRLERVNAFFNRAARWQQDIDIWRQHDYWATPLELMGQREGDCEDFSVAKYMSLLIAGVPESQLRITYVKAELGAPGSGLSQAHMVLAWYAAPNADPLILDNMVSEIRPASRRNDLSPVFSFNTSGLWVGSARAPASREPGARLSRWRDLLQRMAAEGLIPAPLNTE